MSESTVKLFDEVTSANGSQANGIALRVGGHKVVFQTNVPASLGIVQISNDGLSWSTGTNEENSDLSSLGSLTESLKERPEFVRFAVASDGSGPRLFRITYNVIKVN